MNLNRRIVRIVYELSHSDKGRTLKQLADKYGVTVRTIRSDIDTLNVFLQKEGLGTVEYAGGGLLVLPADFSYAEGHLPVRDSFAYKLSSSERKELGAAVLISMTDYITLAKLADAFSVSRATVLNDFDGIKQIVSSAGLSVCSRPSHGVLVEGSEHKRRAYLLEFFLRDVPIAEQLRSMQPYAGAREDNIVIRKLVNEQCHALGIQIQDQPFNHIVTYLWLAVVRNRLGCYLEVFDETDKIKQTSEFEHGVIDLVSQYCEVDLGKNEELAFASFHRSLHGQGEPFFSVYDMRVQQLTRLFIHQISNDLNINLNKDYDLFEYLSNHLESMFSTEPSHFPENPALEECVEGHPEVLVSVKRNLGTLEDYAGRCITRVEMLYVALHICAALERRKSHRGKPRIIVVCSAGVATSRLLAEELRSRFEIRIAKVLSAHDAPYIDGNHADLVITTVPLTNILIDSVTVHLPLRDDDVQRISEKLAAIAPSLDDQDDDFSAQGVLDRIEPIIKKYVSDNTSLIRDIHLEVRNYFHETQNLENQIMAPFLHQLLPPTHIQLDVVAADWQAAITAAAQPLKEAGYIEDRYILAMIDDARQYGPYSVLAPHFAVPHSSPQNGAIKTGMNLIRLKSPVRFDAGENDPISFVCVLSAVDKKTHLRAFANLVDLLGMSNAGFVMALREAQTPEEASRTIERFEFMIV